MKYSLILTLAFSLILVNGTLSQNNKKALYGVLLDNSNAMITQYSQVSILGKEVVKRFRERGVVSIFGFQTKTPYAVLNTGSEWTQDEKTLNAYIDKLPIVTGKPAIYGSIEALADLVNSTAATKKDELGDKVLILITNGDDRIKVKTNPNIPNNPEKQFEMKRRERDRLIKKLKEMGITVYAIGLTTEISADSDETGIFNRVNPRVEAETFLEKITGQTGGKVVFQRSKKIEIDTLINTLLKK